MTKTGGGPATPRAALAFVRRHGIVLMAARGPVPSLADAIAGGPFRGSWWGHPLGGRMFRLFEAVADSRDVLVCRLVQGKITFVHRRVWPALVRLAPRFAKRSLAAVRQEHTSSGRHRNVVTPFPKWVPRDVLAQGRRLDAAAAGVTLAGVLPAPRRRAAHAAGLLVAGLILAALPGCGPAVPPAPPVPATPVDAPGVPYATTYAGEIPCADCPSQRLTLTLFPDGSWRLRRTYKSVEKGQDRSVYEIGRREASDTDRSRLILQGLGDALQLRFVAGDRLQLLDRNGQPIASKANDLLALQSTVDTIAGPLPLRGLYTYKADAASFQECLTGKTLPILPVAAGTALQSAYLAARHKPGAPVFASLTGAFVDRSPEPGAPVREHLIVTQVERLAPGEACNPPAQKP
ncbi:MAG TPA: copper resistance protein NlpE N-terminal domain-containing protein [Verrucomicrobiae bacterium]|nr:copper resistance protein NlpE N-terminal domain-containing protein [Verrucomicrobiae bacterium]